MITPVGYVVLTVDRAGRTVFADNAIYIGELQARYVAMDLGADDPARDYFVCALRLVPFPEPDWL